MTDDERELNEEESELWDYVTKNDERWKDVKKPTGNTQKKEQKAATRRQPLSTSKTSPPEKHHEKELPYLREGEVVGLDRSTSEKLRRGKLKIEATLDMHGMTQDEAFDALRYFILGSHDKRKRCVLVITGKGAGILRSNLPRWINAPDVRPYVLIYTHAHQKDGGDGAFYVLLRRK